MTEVIDPSVDVSVIIVSYNTEHLLSTAINSLRRCSSELFLQVIIVDNASRDGSVAHLRRYFSDCTLIENSTNVGFGRANNQALPLVRSKYVLLLNTDAFVEEGSLNITVDYMNEHPQCGILGVKLVGRDGKLQPSCRYFPTPFNMFLRRTGLQKLCPWVSLVDDMGWDHASSRECDWVPGCYLLLRREVIDQIGLFDERYFLYSEEVDLCFSAKKAGWQVHYVATTEVVHLGGESAKSDAEITDSGRQVERLQIESELLYFSKNYGVLIVWMHIILTMIGDFLIPLKRLFKRRLPCGWMASIEHSLMYLKILRRTKFGTRATR